MPLPTNSDAADRYSVSNVVGVVADPQSYRNLLYLVLAFPLGLIYYFILVFGFVLGIALSVFVVGLGILMGTAIGLRYLASFERRLANRLLGTNIAAPDDVDRASHGIVGTAKAYLRASSTWRGLGFLALKFPIGVLSFILLVTFLGTGVDLFMSPVAPGGFFNVEMAGWEVARSVETTAERAVAVPVGAVLAVVALHLLNAFAAANAAIASSLLGPTDATADEPTGSE